MKITATIITLNEERNIARAIESLRCCDEILIVDSGSMDRTVELAAEPGRARDRSRLARLRRRRRTGPPNRPPTIGFCRSMPTRR